VAREFVEAIEAQRNGDLQALKNFVTETLGQVWVQKSGAVAVSELAEHLRGSHWLKECPSDTAFLVTTADIGYSGDDMLFHWMTQAWSRGAQGAIVDFGLIAGRAKWVEFLSREYPIIGSTMKLPVKDFPIGLDSGKFTTEVYELVDQMGGRAVAMKGDSKTDRGHDEDQPR
jgi:phage terminase large subunit GpA-like protein